jgi:hypothetical protein
MVLISIETFSVSCKTDLVLRKMKMKMNEIDLNSREIKTKVREIFSEWSETKSV